MATKLSGEMLRRIIAEEAAKFRRLQEKKGSIEGAKEPSDVDADEVEADELADTVLAAKDHQPKGKLKSEARTLDEHVDMLKVLKLEEARLERRLKRIREEKRIVAKKIGEA